MEFESPAFTHVAENLDLLQLIDEARDAEACRDIEKLRNVLSPIWEDLEEYPAFRGTDEEIEAELLRLCGFFIGYYGHLKNKPDFQERGKDLLSASIGLFENLGLNERAAQARLNLAWRYQQQGAYEEAEVIFDFVNEQFKSNRNHPVYLQLRLGQSVVSIAKGDVEAAYGAISEIEPAMEKCDDVRIRAQFHIEAGFVYTEKKNLGRATFHHEMAAVFARKLNNDRFTAIVLGNLAYVLKDEKAYAEAHKQIEKAISLNRDSDQEGFLAHNYDTKAQIHLDEGEYEKALDVIDKSLKLFSKGEDYAGFSDAIFNKVRILLKLHEIDEALLLFSELTELARTKISEAAARKYIGDFRAKVFFDEGRGFKEEVGEFKKFLLKESITDADNLMKDAAVRLKISQANLSDILCRQFPEIFTELGLKRRRSRKFVDSVKAK